MTSESGISSHAHVSASLPWSSPSLASSPSIPSSAASASSDAPTAAKVAHVTAAPPSNASMVSQAAGREPSSSASTSLGASPRGSDSGSTTAPSITKAAAAAAAPVAAAAGSKSPKVLPYLFEDAALEDVVVLVADMLTKLTQHNDSLPLHPASLTRFHSRATPNITLPAYLRRIAKYTSVEKCCMLILLVYIDRVCERMAGFTICGLTVHRFVCAAVLCASKALCDAFNTNEHYSRVGGITLAEMNLLEKEFLNIIDWRLTCSGSLLQHYYASLVRSHEDYKLADLEPGQEAAIENGAEGETEQGTSLSASASRGAGADADATGFPQGHSDTLPPKSSSDSGQRSSSSSSSSSFSSSLRGVIPSSTMTATTNASSSSATLDSASGSGSSVHSGTRGSSPRLPLTSPSQNASSSGSGSNLLSASVSPLRHPFASPRPGMQLDTPSLSGLSRTLPTAAAPADRDSQAPPDAMYKPGLRGGSSALASSSSSPHSAVVDSIMTPSPSSSAFAAWTDHDAQRMGLNVGGAADAIHPPPRASSTASASVSPPIPSTGARSQLSPRLPPFYGRAVAPPHSQWQPSYSHVPLRDTCEERVKKSPRLSPRFSPTTTTRGSAGWTQSYSPLRTAHAHANGHDPGRSASLGGSATGRPHRTGTATSAVSTPSSVSSSGSPVAAAWTGASV